MDSCRSLKEQAAGWGDLDHVGQHKKLYFLGLICSFYSHTWVKFHATATSIWNSAGWRGGGGRWTYFQCRLAPSSRCLDTYMVSKCRAAFLVLFEGWKDADPTINCLDWHSAHSILDIPRNHGNGHYFYLFFNFFQFSAFCLCNCLHCHFLLTLAADLCRLVNLRGFCRPAKRSFRKKAPSDAPLEGAWNHSQVPFVVDIAEDTILECIPVYQIIQRVGDWEILSEGHGRSEVFR